MGDRPLWQLSACELVETITSGERAASEVRTAAVERMRERNPHINAVVHDLGDEALILAAEHDHVMARKGPIGPLHGVPITIKENIDQKGCTTPNGVSALKDVRAPGDSPVVRNLKLAGAIIIGHVPTRRSSPFAPQRTMSCTAVLSTRGMIGRRRVARLVVPQQRRCLAWVP